MPLQLILEPNAPSRIVENGIDLVIFSKPFSIQGIKQMHQDIKDQQPERNEEMIAFLYDVLGWYYWK